MDDIQIRQGETLEISIIIDDLTADTVTLTAINSSDDVVITETENFATVDGERVATIETNSTNLPVGDYEYMLTIEYSDGKIDKLPDADCDDDCDLPVIKICEAIDLGVS